MAKNTIHYILADEVGLGKTIEAKMFIKELKTRGMVRTEKREAIDNIWKQTV